MTTGPDNFMVQLDLGTWNGEVVTLQARSLRSMDETIAKLNIKHFRKLLAEETDESKRQTLRKLIAEEEAKLASLGNSPATGKDRHHDSD